MSFTFYCFVVGSFGGFPYTHLSILISQTFDWSIIVTRLTDNNTVVCLPPFLLCHFWIPNCRFDGQGDHRLIPTCPLYASTFLPHELTPLVSWLGGQNIKAWLTHFIAPIKMVLIALVDLWHKFFVWVGESLLCRVRDIFAIGYLLPHKTAVGKRSNRPKPTSNCRLSFSIWW